MNDGLSRSKAGRDVTADTGVMAVLSSTTRDMTLAEAEAAVLAIYGFAARVSTLRSERDQNFLVERADGPGAYVFKLCNAAQDASVADFQTKALLHVAAVDPGLPVPRVLMTRDGAAEFAWGGEDGGPRVGRLVSYVEGAPLAAQPRTLLQTERLGHLAARLGRALRGYFHPAAGHELLWDLRQAASAGELTPSIDAPVDRRLAEAAMEVFRTDIGPRLPGLRGQVIHNDLNPHNVLVDPSEPDRPCGIIDFGDMVHGALVNDVAIAAAYLVGGEDPLGPMCRFAAAYHSVTPLERGEVELLPGLIATRHAMTLAITHWRARRYPGNGGYIVRNQAAAVAGLSAFAALERPVAQARFLGACGMD